MLQLTSDDQKLIAALQRQQLHKPFVALFERLLSDKDKGLRRAAPALTSQLQGQAQLLEDLIEALNTRR